MTGWLDLSTAVCQPWTGVYLRLLSVVLAYGAPVHVGNMLGLSGTPWNETPMLWRLMDVVLLLFNVVVAVGLWLRAPWSPVAYVLGVVLLQVAPYTLFRRQFIRSPTDAATLDGLLWTHALLVAVLVVLLISRSRSRRLLAQAAGGG